MYKKISHSIVEEHFDHPALAAYAVGASTGTMSSNDMALPVLPPLTRYRFISEYFWFEYVWYLNELVHSVMLTDGTKTAPVQERFLLSAAQIAAQARGIFGIDAANVISSNLTTVSQDIVELIKASKAGTDITAIKTALTSDVQILAQYLNNLNPSTWNTDTVISAFNNIVNLLLAEITAMKAGNWNDELSNREQIKLAVLAVADLYASGMWK
jgi:hypothetical protein